MSARAVLFDFDGTLADSAPDLAAALNEMRAARRLDRLPLDRLRPYASSGARGLLRVGFGLTPDLPVYAQMREEFLARYDERICAETRLFPGIAELLARLGRPWGIVTNKALRFTQRIVAALKLEPACVVGGDSTPHLKPHPAPLLLASEQLSIPCQNIVYLGDDLRDVQAARAAGMRAVAVEWGYHGPGGSPHGWQADLVLKHPIDLMEHL